MNALTYAILATCALSIVIYSRVSTSCLYADAPADACMDTARTCTSFAAFVHTSHTAHRLISSTHFLSKEYEEEDLAETLDVSSKRFIGDSVLNPTQNATRFVTNSRLHSCVSIVAMTPCRHRTQAAWLASLPQLPDWNGGRSHVIVNLCDRALPWRPGVAMIAQSNMRRSFWRPGYDISLPLPQEYGNPAAVDGDHREASMVEQREQESALLAALRVLPPRRRKHFLTFKGTVYDRSSSHPDAAQRLRLLPLHDPEEGVVVVGRCMPPEKDPKCAEYRRAFDTYEFEDLANTTFGLVPAGRSPATYRLAEVMAAGAIPVVVASDYVLPFTGTVDWSVAAIQFPFGVEGEIVAYLRTLDEEAVGKMQQAVVRVWDEIWRSGNIAPRVLTEIAARIEGGG